MDEPKHVPFSRLRLEGTPLPGAPTCPDESVFLSEPELGHIANTAVEYALANSATRKHIEDRIVREVMDDPSRLSPILDALARLEATGGYTRVRELYEAIVAGFERGKWKEFPPRREVLRSLLALTVHDQLYSQIAENILRKMIEGCKDSQEVMDFLYQCACAGFMSGDSQVISKTLEVFALESNLLTPNSKQGMLYLLSRIDPSDDRLQKSIEINQAFALQSRIYGSRAGDDFIRNERNLRLSGTYLGLEEIFITQSPPGRLEAIKKYYNSPATVAGRATAVQRNIHSFPYNLVLRGGPLHQWTIARGAEEIGRSSGQRAYNLFIGPVNTMQGDIGRAATAIWGHLNTNTDQIPPMEEEKYWETLSYLLPEAIQNSGKLQEIFRLNENLKQDMIDNTRYLLSPRGDSVEVIDPTLKELGFHSIAYHMDPRNKRDTIVTLSVGNFLYRVLLDEYFALRKLDTRDSLSLPLESSFLQHIILSHLHEIRCFKRGMDGARVESSIGEGAAEEIVTVRRAFKRLLKEGDNPTEKQIEHALENYHIDIIRMNRELAARGETRRYTWVREIDPGDPSLGPVRSQRPRATDDLQEILSAPPANTSPAEAS